MSKSIPVTDGTNVIYTIELKKDFGDTKKKVQKCIDKISGQGERE